MLATVAGEFILDIETPRNRPLSALYKRSFAFETMKDRCPVIITRVIDSLSREKSNIVSQYGKSATEDLKAAIGELSQLKNHLQTNKPLTYFKNPDPDLSMWNEHLNKKQDQYTSITYFQVDWLFAECYLYRKIREIFALRELIHDLDPFWYQKLEVLTGSMPCIEEIITKYETAGLFSLSRETCRREMKNELSTLIRRSLWANRMDLSKSGGDTTMNCDIYIGDVKTWDCNILADDTEKLLRSVFTKGNSERIIEIILDNSGFELFSDLCLADYLVSRCGYKKVHLRAKPIPWYVSDATKMDIEHTISSIQCSKKSECLKTAARWQNYLNQGVWKIKLNSFWCTAYNFSEMVSVDPDLYGELQRADLVIVKGDLNYRKLVQDMNWEPTVKFGVSLGNFHPAPLVALRTCKADTVVGLEQGVARRAEQRSDKWMVSGEFGLIQFDCPRTELPVVTDPEVCDVHQDNPCPPLVTSPLPDGSSPPEDSHPPDGSSPPEDSHPPDGSSPPEDSNPPNSTGPPDDSHPSDTSLPDKPSPPVSPSRPHDSNPPDHSCPPKQAKTSKSD